MEQYQIEIKEAERTTLNKVIDLLSTHKYSQPFLKPVEYVRLGLLDYPLVIQSPMDLQTVRDKLRDHLYRHVGECLQDLLLIWENCRRYNDSTNKLLVKWANGMEAYQLRITKNYLPPPRKAGQKKGKKQTPLKIEEKQEVKFQACKIQERQEKVQQPPLEEKMEEKMEANVETNVDCSAHLDNLAIQAQSSLQKINEVMRRAIPKIDPSIESSSKWDIIGHQIREHFLDQLKDCNDCEVTLIFMMIKRRCHRCIEFDREGNSNINLSAIDDYTIALATAQIKVWKNKHALDLTQ